jgi:hypothetical protein
MSQSEKRSGSELTALMGRVFESSACEAFGSFVTRRLALSDLAAMVEAHLNSLSDDARDALLERASSETGRRLHAAAFTLLEAADAARLPVEVTPEMVAVAAVTELGDSLPDS